MAVPLAITSEGFELPVASSQYSLNLARSMVALVSESTACGVASARTNKPDAHHNETARASQDKNFL